MEFVWLSVAIWFTANMISTISSKAAMLDAAVRGTSHTLTDWTPAFEELLWLDLTVLQHLTGSIAASFWVIVIQRKSIFADLTITSTRYMLIAAAGNALGNMATNASFAAVSSSITQVIKLCEPIFTLALTLLLYRQGKELISSLWVSVVVMVIGSCMFISSQSSFNMWGIGAAAISNIAFPVRNIYLKKSDLSAHQDPLQQFAAISIYSVIILIPWVGVKYLFYALPRLHPAESIMSSIFHFIYNAASITVLQAFNPVVHALLNLSKRVIVIIANLVYFATPVSLQMVTGLLIFFTGLALLQLRRNLKSPEAGNLDIGKHKPSSFVNTLLLVCTVCFAAFGLRHSLYNIQSDRYSERFQQHYPKIITKLRSAQLLNLTTAWVYDNSVPENIVQNLANMTDRNLHYNLNVYCGTSQCLEAFGRFKRPNIMVKFLVLTDIMRETPLEEWLARHPIHKIMTGVNFEEYLHDSVRLALLWKHGGMYVNPLVSLHDFKLPESSYAWLSADVVTTNMSRVLLDLCYFPPQHSFIMKLMKAFTDQFPHQNIPKTSESKAKLLTFNFPAIVRNMHNALKDQEISCPKIIAITTGKLTTSGIKEHHFGTLSYDLRIKISGSSNLGDEMQGFSGVGFLPFVDNFVDREDLRKSQSGGQITMFLNAWWGTPSTYWPPPENIDPIIVSMHFTAGLQNKIAQGKAFFETKAPIGSRDTDTLAFFQKNKIDAFFSGCLTILTQNPNTGKPANDIFMVDVNSNYQKYFPEDVRKNAKRLYHNLSNVTRNDMLARYQTAYNLLESYSRAKLVITQRLHCAMPCVAMGIPVIFIDSPRMPGGGGSSKRGSSRIQGLKSVFHTLDMYQMSDEDAKTWLSEFKWNNPPPNPGVSDVMKFRATDWNIIRKNQHLYDSARKFGMLPLSRYSSDASKQLLFHVLLTRKEDESTVKPTWFEMRSVESILRHHPLATVNVYSDTVQQRQFDVLTESGYNVQVHSLNLTDMVKHMALDSSLTNMLSKNSDTLDCDLIPMLILYRWGGIYMSPVNILVRSIDKLKHNSLLWKNEGKQQFEMSFMKFEKEHVFVKTSLIALLQRSVGVSGAQTLTETWRRESEISPNVEGIEANNFHVSFTSENKNECFDSKDGATFDANMKKVKSNVFLVRVEGLKNFSGKLKDGTICKYIYNSFCVLCNEKY
ncbi:uncharacterized protein LOC117304949 [Asterias rubens]|uniref:uncharacterized protein LOC117304949 n=1 Tax=Asterias rubens TaxID=7604 RepID=UPI0014559878|nr:uncharacterized protein LOC117304949 [Asterias rubens]